MIARIWRGKTPASKADEYLEFVVQRAIPDYQSVEGNCAAYVLRRVEGDDAQFLTVTFWKSEAAIEEFAGPDIEIAKYYPEDDDFLLGFEPTVAHYEVYSAVTNRRTPCGRYRIERYLIDEGYSKPEK